MLKPLIHISYFHPRIYPLTEKTHETCQKSRISAIFRISQDRKNQFVSLDNNASDAYTTSLISNKLKKDVNWKGQGGQIAANIPYPNKMKEGRMKGDGRGNNGECPEITTSVESKSESCRVLSTHFKLETYNLPNGSCPDNTFLYLCSGDSITLKQYKPAVNSNLPSFPASLFYFFISPMFEAGRLPTLVTVRNRLSRKQSYS